MRTESSTDSGKGKRTRKAKKVVGRQDSQGQEASIDNTVIEERIDNLVAAKAAAEEAAEKYSSDVKKAAEDSGNNTGTVRAYVDARAGDGFDKIKKRVSQLALIFGVVDKIETPDDVDPDTDAKH